VARKLNGKWGGPHRQTLALIERTYWVRWGKAYRTVTKAMSEIDYVQAIAREPKGWHHGARVQISAKL